MPTQKTRASATADAVSCTIIKNMREMGAFDENGYVVQPVLDNCSGSATVRHFGGFA